MKIMIFIHGYLPGEKFGGPVTSISNFADIFGKENEIKIVCCNHDLNSKEPYRNIQEGWNRVGNAAVQYLPDTAVNYKSFLAIIREVKPDLIYASGIYCIGFNAPMFKAAKENEVPVLLAPRGDICSNALRIKAYKKIPFLAILKFTDYYKNVYFHATMQEEEDNLKKYLGIDEKRIFLLPNLPSVPAHKKDYFKEPGKLKAVFISRIQSKKNLLDAIKAVNGMSFSAQFDVYGPVENREYWELCETEIRKAPEHVRITYKGPLVPKEAKRIYLNYDCFLFPTLSENYGHVIAEALLHDCPVIISKGTTPWDDVEDYGAGKVVELGDIPSFSRALDQFAALNEEGYRQIMTNLQRYNGERFQIAELKRDYEKMIGKCITSLCPQK